VNIVIEGYSVKIINSGKAVLYDEAGYSIMRGNVK